MFRTRFSFHVCAPNLALDTKNRSLSYKWLLLKLFIFFALQVDHTHDEKTQQHCMFVYSENPKVIDHKGHIYIIIFDTLYE